jgi:antitoxin ParD1/3/4
MTTYKKYITINDPNHVVLSNLPFRSGQQVEIVVIAKDEQSSNTLEELQKLFKITQALPQAQTITEDEIAAEIAAYRSGQ